MTPTQSSVAVSQVDHGLGWIKMCEERILASFLVMAKILAMLALLLLGCGELRRVWTLEFGQIAHAQVVERQGRTTATGSCGGASILGEASARPSTDGN